MERKKCCKCVKPGSIPVVVKTILKCQASLLINSTRNEKNLSRIKKELKHVLARWSSGKDKVLQVCEANTDRRKFKFLLQGALEFNRT